MDNKYLSILESEDAERERQISQQKDTTTLPSSAPASGNKYMRILQDEQSNRDTQFKATTRSNIDVNPDKAAEQRRTANFLGAPSGYVNSFPEDAARAAKLKELDQNTQDAPLLRQKYTDADFAKLAHDDSGTLASVEKWASGAGSFAWAKARAGWFNLTGTATVLAGDVLGAIRPDEAAILFKDKPEEYKKWQESAAGFFSRASRHLFTQADKATKDFNATAKEAYGDKQYFTADADKSALLSPVKIAGDAIESLPTTLALAATAYLTKNAGTTARVGAIDAGLSEEAAMIAQREAAIRMAQRSGTATEGATGYAQTKGSVDVEMSKADLSKSPRYAQLLKEGYTPEMARDVVVSEVAQQSAEIAGVVDAATNMVAGKFLGKIFGESGPLVKRTASGFATEGATEFVQSGGEQFGQNWAESVGINPDTSLTKDVAESAFAGLFVGGLTGGGFAAVLGSTNEHAQNVKGAEQTKEFIDNLVKATEESKTHARAPEVFQEFLQSTTDGTPAQDIYISAQVFAQSGLGEKASQVMPSVAEQLPDALASNGYIRIPTAEYISKVAGTDLNAALVDNVKLDPNGYTFSESQEFSKSFNQEMTSKLEKMMTEQDGDQQFRESRDQVRDKFLEELNTAKRFTPDANMAYANMLASFYAVQAAKLGITPQEMVDRYQLAVQNKGIESQRQFDQNGEMTPEFKQWFADSKVVDAEGKPLTMYHGTGKDFDTFQKQMGRQLFFSPDPEFASEYANSKGGNVMPVYISAKKVWDFQNPEDMAAIQKHLKLTDEDVKLPQGFDEGEQYIAASNGDWSYIESRDFQKFLKQNGYDGFYVMDDGVKNLGVFEPNQIKSVFNERPTNDANILNQAAVEEGKNAITGNLDRVNPAVREAVEARIARLPEDEQQRIRDNLETFKGTAWAAAAVKGMAYREMLERAMSGQDVSNLEVNEIWGKQDMSATKLVQAFKKFPVHGDKILQVLVNSYDFIGGNRKAENDISTSFTNCDPSRACAVHCYAAGSNARPNEIAKSEFTEFMMEKFPQEMAEKIAGDYLATAAGKAGLTLRLNDKGDLSPAQVNVVNNLNARGIAVQVFSKRPELLRQLSDINLKMLSIDSTNMDVARANPDLRLAVTITDDMTQDMLKEINDRVSVYLPVNLKGKAWTADELKASFPDLYPEMKRETLCPVDGGRKTTAPGTSFVNILDKTSEKNVWTCTACDYTGAAGCFNGDRKTNQRKASVVLVSDLQKELQTKKVRKELQDNLDQLLALGGIDEELHKQLSETLSSGQRAVQAIAGYEGTAGSGEATSGTSQDGSASGSGTEQDAGNASKTLDQPARGNISFADDITRQPSVIALLKNADLSTFIHEGGHFFLQVNADLASRIEGRINAGEQISAGEQSIVTDMNKTLDWLGVTGTPERSAIATWLSMPLQEQRPYHEKWARGFEAYAFEGNAPTADLQATFQKFRAWLLNIYRSLKGLDVELSDEVRGVMDRMLATTEQIQAAEAARAMGPLFTPETAQGVISDWQAYHDLGTAATQTAIDELQARKLSDMKWLGNAQSRKLKELQKTAKLLRNEAMMEARREIMSQPVYVAWQFLTAKISEDDKIKAAEKRKSMPNMVDPQIDSLFTAIAKLGGIDREQAISQWGLDPKERIAAPVFGKPVVRAKDGLALDRIAQSLVEDGYLTTDEDGKYDLNELEEKFLDELAGREQYSVFVDPTIFMDEGRPGQGLNLDVMEAGRLDLLALQTMGLPPEIVERLKDLKMTSKNGIDPDLVAERPGIEMTSGDEMVRALAAVPKPKEAIEALTDKIMLERHGDLATPEGLQRATDRAIHNEARLRFLHVQAKALDTAMSVRKDSGKTNVRGQKMTYDVLPKAAREFAERIVNRIKVRDLRPSQFTAAETKAAKESQRQMLKGDIAKAAEENRNTIINAYTAKAAMQAQEDVLKAAAYFRKFDKRSKTIDPDYYDQIVQMLERFDFNKGTSLKEIDKRTSLATWLESQREAGIVPTIPPALENEAYRQSYKNMSVEEVRGLYDTIKQIEHLGRLKAKLLTAQDAREFAVIRDEITATIEQYAGDRQADNRTPNTILGEKWNSVKKFWASHIKAATWARIMDGGKDGGPMWEYLIRTANERGDMEVEKRKQATRTLSELVAPVLKEGKMGGKGMFFEGVATAQDKNHGKTGSSFNKEARLAMALNMGNASNMQRLLGGEGWTLEQIKPVLDTLTEADWKFVQSVWDYFESFRPEIGAKQKRVYGVEPQWLEAQALTVQTADGKQLQLRGGYYPVKYDPRASMRAEEAMDAEEARRGLQAAYTSTTTRRSFTKERVDAVEGRPLLYSLDGIYQGVNEVIHDLAWHEWLIDSNRIIKNPKIAEMMRDKYGVDVHNQFKAWLKDVAEGDRGAANSAEKFFGWVRQGVSVSGLGINIMSALTQPFGITQSIVRIGPKYVGRGMQKFLSAPIETANEIYKMSSFMENRALTRMRELADLRNQVKGQSKVRETIDATAYAAMMRAQQLVDIPTWWGAYEKATAEGNDTDRAVALADQAVIDAQGSGTTKDQSAVERGGPLQKLFTTFYSFMNVALNLGVERTMTAKAREASKASMAANYLLLYVVPVIFIKAMKDALTPGDNDDWEDPEKLARMLAKEELSFMMGMIFGVREMAGVAEFATGKPIPDYTGPAGLRMLGDAQRLGKEIQQGEADDGLRKAVVNFASELLRLPGAQINRTITGIEALSDGETDNPAAVLFGYQRQR